jgi:hypothetical protein
MRGFSARNTLAAATSAGSRSPGFAALALSGPAPHPVACALELGDGHGLVEFGHGAEDLSNELGRGAVIKE